MGKELWVSAYEELFQDYVDQGLSDEDATTRAENEASEHMYGRLYSRIDHLMHRGDSG